MNHTIELTMNFLNQTFENSTYLKEHPSDKAYRLEHSYRVANIGKQIAEAEGFNTEYMVIGCLLHDIGYASMNPEVDDMRNHGRVSAQMARPFLESLKLSDEAVNEICYGIAIHVDDVADFEGERTPLALSISDADNIDRFDAYRIYETLEWRGYSKMSLDEKLTYVTNMLVKLEQFKSLEFATKTGKNMWIGMLEYQITYYQKLKNQLDNSVTVL